MTEQLLKEIDRFLERYPMAESTFGKMAVNDGKLVRRLKEGGRCWPETEDRIKEFMRSYESPNKSIQ